MLVIGVTLAVALGSLAIYLFWPVQYAAYASVLVRAKALADNPQTIQSRSERSVPVDKEDLFSEVQMLRSTEVIGRTLARLQREDGADAGVFPSVSGIRKSLKLDVLPVSNVIQLSLAGPEPERLQRILDTLTNEYLKFRVEVSQGSQTQVFFHEQAEKFRHLLEDAEQELTELVNRKGSADPAKEIETLLMVKRDLEVELNQLSRNAIEAETQLNELVQLMTDPRQGNPSLLSSPLTSVLNNRLLELKTERSKLLRTYLPGSKAVAQVDSEISEMLSLVVGEMDQYKRAKQAELAVLQAQIAGVTSRMQTLNERNLELQQQIMESRRIEREIALHQQSYETFARRREEARIRAAMESADLSAFVTVLNKAYPSDGPIFPRPILVPLGLVSGLLLGLALGFSREFFDHTFKKPADVERVLGLPMIFSLGDLGEPPKSRSLNPAIAAGFLLLVCLGMGLVYGPGRELASRLWEPVAQLPQDLRQLSGTVVDYWHVQVSGTADAEGLERAMTSSAASLQAGLNTMKSRP